MNTVQPKRLAAVLTLAVFALAGCSSIDAGRVTAKVHEPARQYVSHYQCYSYDSKGLCKLQMPVYAWDDEDWRLDIRDGDKTGWVYVTEQEFTDREIGDWVDYSSN